MRFETGNSNDWLNIQGFREYFISKILITLKSILNDFIKYFSILQKF